MFLEESILFQLPFKTKKHISDTNSYDEKATLFCLLFACIRYRRSGMTLVEIKTKTIT